MLHCVDGCSQNWAIEMSAKEGALLSNTGKRLLAFVVMKSGNLSPKVSFVELDFSFFHFFRLFF